MRGKKRSRKSVRGRGGYTGLPATFSNDIPLQTSRNITHRRLSRDQGRDEFNHTSRSIESPPRDLPSKDIFPFFQLPAELRVHIYSYFEKPIFIKYVGKYDHDTLRRHLIWNRWRWHTSLDEAVVEYVCAGNSLQTLRHSANLESWRRRNCVTTLPGLQRKIQGAKKKGIVEPVEAGPDFVVDVVETIKRLERACAPLECALKLLTLNRQCNNEMHAQFAARVLHKIDFGPGYAGTRHRLKSGFARLRQPIPVEYIRDCIIVDMPMFNQDHRVPLRNLAPLLKLFVRAVSLNLQIEVLETGAEEEDVWRELFTADFVASLPYLNRFRIQLSEGETKWKVVVADLDFHSLRDSVSSEEDQWQRFNSVHTGFDEVEVVPYQTGMERMEKDKVAE